MTPPPRHRSRRPRPRETDPPPVPAGPPTRDALVALGADRLADLLLERAVHDETLPERLHRELAPDLPTRVSLLRRAIREETESTPPRARWVPWPAARERLRVADELLEEIRRTILPRDRESTFLLLDEMRRLQRRLARWLARVDRVDSLRDAISATWLEAACPPREETIGREPPASPFPVAELARRISRDGEETWASPLARVLPERLGAPAARRVAEELLAAGFPDCAASLAEAIRDPDLLERALVVASARYREWMEHDRVPLERIRTDRLEIPAPGTPEARRILSTEGRRALAEVLEATGKPAEALAVLEAGEPWHFVQERARLLEGLGRIEEALRLRWKILASELSVPAWEKVLALLPPERHAEARERAVRLATERGSLGHSVAFLLDIGELDAAEELALSRPRDDLAAGEPRRLAELADRAREAGRPVLATALLREAVESVLFAGDTSLYARAAGWLRALGEIAGDTALPDGFLPHDRFVTDLRARTRRKRSFWQRVDDPSSR